MSTVNKAIIIGAGPAGLAAALQLHRKNNIDVTVYELRPRPSNIGGSIGIFPNGLRLLHRLGLYDALLARGAIVDTFHIHSLHQGNIGSMDISAWAKKKSGFGFMRIIRRDLLEVLFDAIHGEEIPVHFDKRLVSIEEGASSVTVTFSDGSNDTADILIGCDGIHSSVRRLHVDPATKPEYSGIAGSGAIVSTVGLPEMLRKEANIIPTTAGVIAMFPCSAAGDQLYWFLSRETPIPYSESGNERDGWEVRRQQEMEVFKSTIREMTKPAQGEWRGVLAALVDRTDVIGFYPVFRLPLGGKWYTSRTILLGDAGHAMQPHAGQGTSMALEDAFLLSRVLKEKDWSLEHAFARYEAIRRPRINELYQLAAKNGRRRKATGSWALWVGENVMWARLGLYRILGLESWGLGQTHLVYDIDEVEL
ncbi:FAD-dependent oxidoreductase [Aspergillus saccharolyticus JOP 1030-1]|uniref:Salicylate hydroxylase n=1 Tax=Aspergillus saccharolyticus JOP 1030-1 TaxID=1450539 RepID=A0A318ZAG6_9EURO|nr:salicylate hydroxylase [Aspergillus saccharolyticus JOP 1030-1]PYH43314.1 salicylate hydroxylase [Aspergillus saccharolyticus JOP 1030-1]